MHHIAADCAAMLKINGTDLRRRRCRSPATTARCQEEEASTALEPAVTGRRCRRLAGPSRLACRRVADTSGARTRCVEKFLSLTVSGAVTGAIFSLVAAGPRALVHRDRHLQLLVRRGRVHERVPLLPAQHRPPLADRARRRVRGPRVRAAARAAPRRRGVPAARARDRVGEDHGDGRPAHRDPGARSPGSTTSWSTSSASGSRSSSDVTQVGFPSGIGPMPEGRLEAARRRARSTPTSSSVFITAAGRRGRAVAAACATPRSGCRCARSSTAPTSPAPAASTSAPRRARRG